MAEPIRCIHCRWRLVRGYAGWSLWCPGCDLPLVECGCGAWYVRGRPRWQTCLPCEVRPEGMRRVSRPRGPDAERAVLEIAQRLVDCGEAEWVREPVQLVMFEA
jgi:hypothetical protein